MGKEIFIKIVLTIFFLGTIKVFERLMKTQNESYKKYQFSVFLISSVFVLYSIYYAGNIEIAGVFFFLFSIQWMLEEKKAAYVLAVLAVSFSPVYFLMYFLITLLWNKAPVQIVIKTIMLGVPGIAGSLLLRHLAFFETGNIIWSETILHGLPIIGGNSLSFFIVGFAAISVSAYMNPWEKRKDALYYCLMVMALLFSVFASYQGYYMIITVPLMLLVFEKNKVYFRMNLILYLVYSVCGVICMMWGDESYILRRLLIENERAEYYIRIMASCFAASGILLIIVNFPFYKFKSEVMYRKCERWLVWITILSGYVFLFLTLF